MQLTFTKTDLIEKPLKLGRLIQISGNASLDLQALISSTSVVGISLFILFLAGMVVLSFKVQKSKKANFRSKSSKLLKSNSKIQHKIPRSNEDHKGLKSENKNVQPYIKKAEDLKKAAVLREKMETTSWNHQYNALRMDKSQKYTNNFVQPYLTPKPSQCIKEMDTASLDSTYAVPASLRLNIPSIPVETDPDEIYDVPPRRM
ncbi:uncharacterized protein LOC132210791 [Stegostoma tigrinum]|uniref:uncharacterized protein LOC132210791 n=1 Tax=Stegostoma tigrinum TaxID=3053191 RepID=UPI0028701726|nr:uncharacterized protein LOC132210791 [Stegostoma tigrinum]